MKVGMTVVLIGIILFFASISCFGASKKDQTPKSTKELYELQERCGKSCRERFMHEWGKEGPQRSKDGNISTVTYNAHYNAKLNKCFMVVNYWDGPYTDIALWEIHENKEYGFFRHFRNDDSKTRPHCMVAGQRCSTETHFKEMIKPYMEE